MRPRQDCMVRGIMQQQKRFYYPWNQKAGVFDFEAESVKWKDPAVKTKSVSELYNKIHDPLSECEDILSTWRETKWFNRDLDPKIKGFVTTFLTNKYDHGIEQNFLDRLLIIYALLVNGNFENAFHGYFRLSQGAPVHDTEQRLDTVRKLLFTNMPVIDDLYHLSGMPSSLGYRNALGRMLTLSLEHNIPTGKSNLADHAKVMFQHRQEGEGGDGSAVRLLASVSDDEGIDYMFLHPHGFEGPRTHQLTLVAIGSENKYRRRVQVPDRLRRRQMAQRAEQVFSLPPGSVETKMLLLPPWCLDRSSLVRLHELVGGLAPSYSDWLPYYHYSIPNDDVDWAYQVEKELEDDYYQL